MLRALVLAALYLLLANTAACTQPLSIFNGSFEDVDEGGSPLNWRSLGVDNWDIVPDAARTGALGLRFNACGAHQFLRQQHRGVTGRPFTVCGWFKARGVKMEPETPSGDHARLYVHVLYEGRPYNDGLQAWRDIPPGTYDWRRFVVSVYPNPNWEVSEVWLTVSAQFHEGELLCDDIGVGPAVNWGGASVLDWGNHRQATVITDLSTCQPVSALSNRRQRGKWKVLEYDIPPFSGKLISAHPDTAAEPVCLPLGISGWHAIYVGLVEGKVRLKLSGDPGYVGRDRSSGGVEEVFFRVADLTGRDLWIAQQAKGTGISCAVAWVRLIPLTPEETARIAADRADLSNRRLASSIDGFSYIWAKGPTTREELLEEIEEYRDSDFGTLYIQVTGADHVNYPTGVGNLCGAPGGQPLETFPEPGDRVYTESVLEMFRAGINPTQVHLEGARALGLKAYVGIRPGAWEYGPFYEEYFTSPFYQAHPEWRCVDRDGTPVARMSFAVPEVRAHLVDVLREALQFGGDGVNIIFVRGVPYILWEQPFCRLFQERFGQDARAVPEDDPRITDLRVELMTRFMAEVRAMLDQEAARRGDGRRLEISAFVLANEADNRKYGIDVRGWVEKGLLDEVSPYLGAGGGTASDYDLGFFADACGSKGVPWRPTIIAWAAPGPQEMMATALRYYEAGASGITFWDGNSLTTRTDTWAVVSRLGHVDELRERVAQQGAPKTVTYPLHRIGDFIMDGRYGVMWGY